MGQVYLAYDTLLERQVAVKFIARQEPDPPLREQFFVEARAIARLSHPNVVAIYRVGEVRRRPYLVSEFVRGRSLAELDQAGRRGAARRDRPRAGARAGGGAPARRAPPRHQAGQRHAHRRRRGQAARLRPGPARRSHERAPLDAVAGQASARRCTWRPSSGAASRRRAPPTSTRSACFCTSWPRRSRRTPACRSASSRRVRQERDAPPLADARARRSTRGCARVDRSLPAPRSRRRAARRARRCARRSRRSRCSPRGDAARGQPVPRPARVRRRAPRLFFGREPRRARVVERLRAEPLVVVAGDSGVGKSSLCRAGVLPRLDGRALDAGAGPPAAGGAGGGAGAARRRRRARAGAPRCATIPARWRAALRRHGAGGRVRRSAGGAGHAGRARRGRASSPRRWRR